MNEDQPFLSQAAGPDRPDFQNSRRTHMTVLINRLRQTGKLSFLGAVLALACLIATVPAGRPAHAFSPVGTCCPVHPIYSPEITVALASGPDAIQIYGSGFMPNDAVTLKWYRGYRGDASQPPLKSTTVFATPTTMYNVGGEVSHGFFLNTAQGDPPYYGPTWVLATASGGPWPITIWSPTVLV
jgi:hypothetical protein